eukprot:1723105-Pyramimonas_sp.AAC.1
MIAHVFYGTTPSYTSTLSTKMSSRLLSTTSSTRMREFSGRFSRTLNTWHEKIRERPLQEIKFVTWNTRALLHHKPDVRRKKAAKLKLFCRGAGVVALLEVLGSWPDMLRLRHGLQIKA